MLINQTMTPRAKSTMVPPALPLFACKNANKKTRPKKLAAYRNALKSLPAYK
jgi:hypothetical protein